MRNNVDIFRRTQQYVLSHWVTRQSDYQVEKIAIQVRLNRFFRVVNAFLCLLPRAETQFYLEKLATLFLNYV